MTADAELKFTPGEGKAVCNFSIALDDGYGDNKKTYYINIVCWGKIAENTANYTKKGSLVGVSGKITTRSYDNKEGKKVYVTEINANEVKFLDSKGTGQSQNNNSDYSAPIKNAFDGVEYQEDIEPIEDSGDMPFK